MHDVMRLYKIISMCLFAVTVAVTVYVWHQIPIHGNPWPSVLAFAVLAGLSELLAVNLHEGELTSISPTSPVLWSATCVVGPFPAIIISLVAGLVSIIVRYICYLVSSFVDRYGVAEEPIDSEPNKRRVGTYIHGVIRNLGSLWQVRPLDATAVYIAGYISNLVLPIGVAGIVYHSVGGQFLLEDSDSINYIFGFVFPFVLLVITSTAVDLGIWASYSPAMSPMQSDRGLYTIILTMKIALIEIALPIVRPQMFMLVVSLILSYLYVNIGILGFAVITLPMLALRDFFYQWVEERDAYVNTITTLATYMQHYHSYTRGHLKRVADMAERLARELKLPAESVRFISTAGFLHDIGKIGVSEEILDKTEKLTDDEWGKIKEHPVKGAEIISHIEFLEGIVDWIKYHHKWHNGAGYPITNGDAPEIPIEAAIIAAVDAFDAMTDDRELSLDWVCDSCGYKPEEGEERPEVCPKCGAEKRRRYREPKTLDGAIDEMRRGAGSQFHPKVVKAFLSMIERDGVRNA